MSDFTTTLNNARADFASKTLAADNTHKLAVEAADADKARAYSDAQGTLDKVVKDLAKEFFKAEDATVEDFAKLYGKSSVTARKLLKVLGVNLPEGKRGAKAKYDEDGRREIAQAWLDAKGNTKARLRLALDKDVTEATMRAWAIDLGLFTPKKRGETEVQVTETEAQVEDADFDAETEVEVTA